MLFPDAGLQRRWKWENPTVDLRAGERSLRPPQPRSALGPAAGAPPRRPGQRGLCPAALREPFSAGRREASAEAWAERIACDSARGPAPWWASRARRLGRSSPGPACWSLFGHSRPVPAPTPPDAPLVGAGAQKGACGNSVNFAQSSGTALRLGAFWVLKGRNVKFLLPF